MNTEAYIAPYRCLYCAFASPVYQELTRHIGSQHLEVVTWGGWPVASPQTPAPAPLCEVYYGGYQSSPIRCALPVHTGQHAGIADDGTTVVFPVEAAESVLAMPVQPVAEHPDTARLNLIIEILNALGSDGLAKRVWDEFMAWDRDAIDKARAALLK